MTPPKYLRFFCFRHIHAVTAPHGDSGYVTATRAATRHIQVTPSVTPTSSLSSNETRSTYATAPNSNRGTPNSRGSFETNPSNVPATRNSLALDPAVLRRNYFADIRRTGGGGPMMPSDRNSFASSADLAPYTSGNMSGGGSDMAPYKSATLRALPVQGRAAVFPQFHNSNGNGQLFYQQQHQGRRLSKYGL